MKFLAVAHFRSWGFVKTADSSVSRIRWSVWRTFSVSCRLNNCSNFPYWLWIRYLISKLHVFVFDCSFLKTLFHETYNASSELLQVLCGLIRPLAAGFGNKRVKRTLLVTEDRGRQWRADANDHQRAWRTRHLQASMLLQKSIHTRPIGLSYCNRNNV